MDKTTLRCACTLALAALAMSAAAQQCPGKPVRLVAPFVAGGPTDIQEKSATGGATIIGGTPEQFAAYLKSEVTKFERVVKEAKISAQ